jgi:hypothetical protein
MSLVTAILVAALFFGTAAATGFAPNVTTTQKNNSINNTSEVTPSVEQITQEVVSANMAPQVTTIPIKEDIQGIETQRGNPALYEPFYACKVSPSPYTTFYFGPTPPITATTIAPTGTTGFLSGGTFTNDGEWYACEYSTTSSNIYSINTATGALTLKGASGASLSGISVDKTSGIMYGIGGSATTNQALYTINMATGAATLVGPCSTNTLFIDIVIDGAGNAYAIDLVADSLMSVNLATGATTLIGPLNIAMNYAQDSCYDIDNGIMYHAAYTGSAVLYTINTATGAATLVGAFPTGYSEVDCFAIPYETIAPDHDIGIKAIIEPSAGTAHVFTPKVQVKNFGNNTETNVPVNLKIFRKQVNGTTTDFEANDGGYTHQAGVGGTTPGVDAWEYGVPTSGPMAAHSGTNLWATILAGNYPMYMYANMTTPVFVVPTNGYLEYWQWYYFENSYDGGNVKISNNSGATWTLLTPVGGYPGTMASDPYMTGQPGYTGYPAGAVWKIAHFDFPAALYGQTVQLRFSAGSDSSVQYQGWYIDDVTIGYATWINEYNSTVNIASILSGQTLNLTTFPNWTPFGLGVTQNVNMSYSAEARCNLTGDVKPQNDFLAKTFYLMFGWLHDISVDKIVAPPLTGKAMAYIPKVNVSNIGQNSESSVPVRMIINKNQYTTLMSQNFVGTFLPANWTQDNATEWTQSFTANAGGTSPEARLYWANILGGYAFLQSPAVATSTASILQLKFRSYLDVSGPIYAKVLVRPNNLTAWTDKTPWANPVSADILSALYTLDISALKGTGTQVMFEFTGPNININYWYIDDVQLVNKVTTNEKNQVLYTSLAAGAKVQLTYTSWSPADLHLIQNVSMEYEVNVTATLATDGNQLNNKIIQFTILKFDWFNDIKVNGITKPISGLAQPQTVMVNLSNVGQNDQANVKVNVQISKLNTLLSENFEGTFPPTGWTVVIHQQTLNWRRNDQWPTARPNYAGGVGYCADADADAAGSGGPWPMDTSLVTPVIDLSAVSAASFEYIAAYNALSGDYADVDISIDNGSTWVNLQHWTVDHSASGPGEVVSYDLTPYCGNAQVKIRFHYFADSWDYYFEVDSVKIRSPGSIVEYNESLMTSINAYQTMNVTMPSWTPADILATNIDYMVIATANIMGIGASLYTYNFDYIAATPPVFPPAGWTRYNVNGDGVQWIQSTAGPYSGTYSAFISYASPTNNDWLVSQPVTVPGAGGTFSLWYKAYSATWPEHFKIYYSTSGNTVADFTGATGHVIGEFTTVDAVYHQFTYAATPPGQVWFAVFCDSPDEFGLYLDDFAFPDGTIQGFEGGTPANWNGWFSVLVSGTSTLQWTGVTSGTSPTCTPHSALWMAKYPSYNIPSGNSHRLYNANPVDLTSYGSPTLAIGYWMIHDTGYSTNNENIQVQISHDNITWVNIGSPVKRYDATATTPTWKQHFAEIPSSYMSDTSVWIAFLGTSTYGNNMYIDDASFNVPVIVPDANPADNAQSKVITLSYEHDVGTVMVTEPTVAVKDYRTYVHGPATNAWAATTGNIMGAIRLSPTELAGLEGYRLTAVQWGHNENTTISGWVMVYDNGSTTGPGAVLANQSFTVTGPGEDQGNHTILLQNPVTVNVSQNLWIAVHVIAPYPAEYPMLATTPGIQTKTMWYSSSGGATWSDIYIPTTRNQSWQYKGIFSGPETTVYPPGTYPIAGIVQNYGITFSETNFIVNAKVYKLGERDTLVYQDNTTVTDTLPPGVSAPVSFEDITIENVTAAEGNYRVEITTMLPNDDHTNNDKKTKTFTIFIIDVLPPVTTHSFSGTMGDNDWYISDVTVTLTATDPSPPITMKNSGAGKSPSGVNHTYYKIDTGAWIEYTQPVIVSTDGQHQVWYYSVDKVDNTEAQKGPFNFKIDKTAPVFTEYTFTAQNFMKNKWLCAAVVEDATSGVALVEFYVDDALAGSATAEPWEFLFEGKPINNSQALAYDAAGNSALSPIASYVEYDYQVQSQSNPIQQKLI